MENGLNEQILTAVQGCTAGDYCQRSALGMARTWVDKNKPLERPVYTGVVGWKQRDDLAEQLIAIMEAEDSERDERVTALNAARAVVNAPYLDPSMMGQQEGKALLRPGEKRKAKSDG